jgi:hypothetical protein
MTPTISVRDGRPAIDVKDRTLWAQEPRLSRAYAELGEETISGLWQDTAFDFWNLIVPAIAEPYSYKVYSAGRSGGWLTVDDQHWLAYVVNERMEIPAADDTADDDTRDEYAEMIAERDRFLKFAAQIEAAMEAAGESFVERVLSELAEGEFRDIPVGYIDSLTDEQVRERLAELRDEDQS